MDVVDNGILSSFLQLANHFAVSSGIECINSMTDLWKKHGTFISGLMQLDVREHATSSDFYCSMLRKMRLVNGTLAEGLDAAKAADGSLLEICKFYALYLEFLRKEQGEMLKKFLEQLAKDSNFNSDSLLSLFSSFDNLYEDDCADEWWSILKQEESFIGLSTPTSKRSNLTIFATPTASARRMRTMTNSARRSPIVDAVDSPTMKYLRIEREFKQVKKTLMDCQAKLEDTDADNNALDKENRELKVMVSELRSNISHDRNSVQLAEAREEEIKAELKAKEDENQKLRQQLNGAMQNMRSVLRQIEEAEKEKLSLEGKINSLTNDKERLLRDLRDIRETNESDYLKWQQTEAELLAQIKCTEDESRNAILEMGTMRSCESGMRLEMDRLTNSLHNLEIENGRLKSDKDVLEERIESLTKSQLEAIQKEREDRENALAAEEKRYKMAEITIDRLNRELIEGRNEKDKLKSLMDSLNEKSLDIGVSQHEVKEGYLNAKSCLEAAKRKIELLEVEVRAKDSVVESLNAQVEQVGELLKREQSIRKDMSEQQASQREMLEMMKSARAQLEAELKLAENKIQKAEAKSLEIEKSFQIDIEKLKKENDEERAKNKDFAKKLHDMNSANENTLCANEYWKTRCSADLQSNEFSALGDSRSSLEKDVGSTVPSTGVEENKLETPKRSVAFTIENDENEKRSTMPPGFKLESSHRGSLSSLNRNSLAADETFDRSSIQRSSTRSEYAVSTNLTNFKQPFTPLVTDRNRLEELKTRNNMVRPDLRSSYATEMADVHSPSGDEKTLKQTPGKRRQSLASVASFFRKKQ